jgi:hypothetical protein
MFVRSDGVALCAKGRNYDAGTQEFSGRQKLKKRWSKVLETSLLCNPINPSGICQSVSMRKATGLTHDMVRCQQNTNSSGSFHRIILVRPSTCQSKRRVVRTKMTSGRSRPFSMARSKSWSTRLALPVSYPRARSPGCSRLPRWVFTETTRSLRPKSDTFATCN